LVKAAKVFVIGSLIVVLIRLGWHLSNVRRYRRKVDW
jgi:hypothetical protein